MDKDKRPIIKRKKKCKIPPYGGAWKIAYADFVTAMMAFFLLMWLISMTPEEKLRGLSQYFNDPRGFVAKIGAGLDGGVSESFDKEEGMSKNTKEHPSNENVLINIMNTLKSSIENNPEIKNFSDNITMTISEEGLEINIMDSVGRSIFREGTSDIEPYMFRVFDTVADLISETQNYISLEGHVSPSENLKRKSLDKWDLSSDRANTLRKYLEKNEKLKGRTVKITAKGELEPYDPKDLTNPKNSRIVITILKINSVTDHNRNMPINSSFLR